LFDTEGDARPPEWVVSEVASTAFTVGGHALEKDGVMVSVPIAPVELNPERVDLARYLRERGLFATDGEFLLFEAVVCPGDQVAVSLFTAPIAPVIGKP
jgi:hypothetical protein